MHHDILRRVQHLVSHGQYRLSIHARDELFADWSLIMDDDIEAAIMSGQIVERQWDTAFQEWKYVVEGMSVEGDLLAVVVKLEDGVVVITVYLIR